jgi:hypothetical protein
LATEWCNQVRTLLCTELKCHSTYTQVSLTIIQDRVTDTFSTAIYYNSGIVAQQCPQSPTGYTSPGGAFNDGVPPAAGPYTYIQKPPSLSCDELETAERLCVARINDYRAGRIIFSNGQADPTLGNPADVQHASSVDKCNARKRKNYTT